MTPRTFEFEVAPGGEARAGFGLLAAYVPASHDGHALVAMTSQPTIASHRPTSSWLPAAIRYVLGLLELGDEPLRWAAVDERGCFNQVALRWPGAYGRGTPEIKLNRFPEGIEAFYRATGAAGEVAIELLTLVLEKPPAEPARPTQREFLETIEMHGNLPTHGGVFHKVEAAAKDGDIRRMVKAVQLDPTISAAVLSAANAGNLTVGGKTGSTPQAGSRLGIKAVLRLAFIAEMISRYRHGVSPCFDYAAYWSHSIAIGAAMRALIARYDIHPSLIEDAFATGLMSAIGWLAVAETFPALTAKYLEHCRANDPIAKARAQRELFPCSIRMVTERYLERFEFPEIVHATIAGRANVNRAWYDCLAQASRVAQVLAPFDCIALPTIVPVPEDCRLEWLRWQRALAA